MNLDMSLRNEFENMSIDFSYSTTRSGSIGRKAINIENVVFIENKQELGYFKKKNRTP